MRNHTQWQWNVSKGQTQHWNFTFCFLGQMEILKSFFIVINFSEFLFRLNLSLSLFISNFLSFFSYFFPLFYFYPIHIVLILIMNLISSFLSCSIAFFLHLNSQVELSPFPLAHFEGVQFGEQRMNSVYRRLCCKRVKSGTHWVMT